MMKLKLFNMQDDLHFTHKVIVTGGLDLKE